MTGTSPSGKVVGRPRRIYTRSGLASFKDTTSRRLAFSSFRGRPPERLLSETSAWLSRWGLLDASIPRAFGAPSRNRTLMLTRRTYVHQPRFLWLVVLCGARATIFAGAQSQTHYHPCLLRPTSMNFVICYSGAGSVKQLRCWRRRAYICYIMWWRQRPFLGQCRYLPIEPCYRVTVVVFVFVPMLTELPTIARRLMWHRGRLGNASGAARRQARRTMFEPTRSKHAARAPLAGFSWKDRSH